MRGINDRAALDLLLEHGPLARGRLGTLTGLSKPTASQLLNRLEAAGLVVATGVSAGGPGPAARLYEVNPGAAYVAGLDVTPSRIQAVVADITGRTLGESEVATPRRPGTSAEDQVLAAVDGALAEHGLGRGHLHRVVVGTPGGFDPTTRRLRYARHLPGWHTPRLVPSIERSLGVPVQLENDVNLAAVAERETGRARGVEDFVLLWADEGLGAALVIDGRLHAGATGGAGEVGFLPLPETPLVRNVGRSNTGGFQELAGGKQVLALARSLGVRAGTPHAAVARSLLLPGPGDRLLEVLGHRFALGLAAVVSVLDPAMVVLAGRVLTAGGDRLRDRIRAELGSLAVCRPEIVLASVTDRPVLAGAVHTALARTRDEVFDTTRSNRTAPTATDLSVTT
jgi:predicted NBD/HSP70 family sugar kinase